MVSTLGASASAAPAARVSRREAGGNVTILKTVFPGVFRPIAIANAADLAGFNTPFHPAVSTFPMPLANAAYLGIDRYAQYRDTENWTNGSEADKELIIRTVYRQVLGNQYVMKSERLEGPESLLQARLSECA
jgi:hypothetical protein